MKGDVAVCTFLRINEIPRDLMVLIAFHQTRGDHVASQHGAISNFSHSLQVGYSRIICRSQLTLGYLLARRQARL